VSERLAADPTFRDKTVLIVEDHEDSQSLLAWTFRNLGARTFAVQNVADAQQEIIRRRPDLIISDIALPGESGIQLITWVRGLSKVLGRDTPCIAITAFPQTYPPTSAHGFTAYMRKPLDVPRLCSIAAALLEPASK